MTQSVHYGPQRRAARVLNDAPSHGGSISRRPLWPVMQRVCSGVLASLILSSRLLATTVEEKDLRALCKEAQRAFLGTVAEVQSRWVGAEKPRMETLVSFTNITPLFGDVGDNVVVRFPGGEINGIREEVVGLPQLQTGDRVILLLKEGGVSPIVGFHQGIFHVADGPAGPSVRISAHNLHLAGSGGSAAGNVDEEAAPSGFVPLVAFLDLLRREFSHRQERP